MTERFPDSGSSTWYSARRPSAPCGARIATSLATKLVESRTRKVRVGLEDRKTCRDTEYKNDKNTYSVCGKTKRDERVCERRRRTSYPLSGSKVQWRSTGMATQLSPRNSEVNALEQRGYLIGKKIGQVIYPQPCIPHLLVNLFHFPSTRLLRSFDNIISSVSFWTLYVASRARPPS